MQTHSVENRFIIIVLAALFVFVAPLFALFYFLTAERALSERVNRAEVTMMANAQALGKPLWDFDVESVNKIAASIVSDNDILAVRVIDNSGGIDVQLPETVDVADAGEIRVLQTDIQYASIDGTKHVGFLKITIGAGGFLSLIHFRELAFMGIFAFAVVILSAAAIIANRITIIRPLLKLTEAISATRHLGSRHRVDWDSSDEMGVLAKNFNDMQTELEREEMQLRSAHALVQSVYNQTPAMLYSLDAAGDISAVSDYWILATGYQRHEVIGRPFQDFVAKKALSAYRRRAKPAIGAGATPGVTVSFLCANGETIDVLIRETAALSENGQFQSLSVMTDVTELKEAENRNHRQAITDHLTGLLNRQGFEITLDEKIAETDQKNEELACLFIDLDRFKWVNDNLGHAAGDAVLREVCKRITNQIRPTDTVARIGGDEFAILVPARDVKAAASNIAERIIDALEEPYVLENNVASLSGSVGIALYPAHAKNAAELLQKSDMAMYERKRNGKNGTQFFSDTLSDMARVRSELERDISDALENDWFEPWMQPIVSLKTGQVVGFEALMRLCHPMRGVLPPADIIVAAEENGTIHAIGDRIMEKAVEYIARIHKMPGFEKCRTGINISPLQITPDLPAKFSAYLMKHNVAPSSIVLEITEAVLMQENPEIFRVLDILRDSGMNLALDDFGTGYSSLSYLHRFPVNVVKIDKSFIRALTPESAILRDKSYLLLEGICTIAHQIDCDVVAEGIEDAAIADLLAKMGIDFVQGFHFAKPMSIGDVENIYGSEKQRHIAAN
ncbi:EAL domain-containing protein [Rhizobium sp. L1K21]|nr:EAL domain-containing protein [Rhizobium sp. L1K21]